MYSLKKALSSGLARKLLNGVTAIGLVAYLFVHLLGNLVLYWPDAGERFNEYSALLHSFGWGLHIVEVGLLIIFLLHAGLGMHLWWQNRKAKKDGYEVSQKTKGGPSNFNLSSISMPLTGAVLLIFTAVHVLHFRFAAFTDEADYVPIEPDGNPLLYEMVVDAFANPWWVAFYCVSIFIIGWHLRHGFWSIFQTIGAMNERWTKPVYALGTIIAVILTAGFFFIPLYIFFVIN